ncbi:MAG TPA: hypothetical protein VFC65_01065 [Prolixibacteraceae bacterium]|nr:hypothetical protein [Prolixibacteraceae bacterium]
MKKTIFYVFVLIFTMTTSMSFASKTDMKSASDKSAVPVENKMSNEEVTRLTNRVEEIRSMDKSDMSVSEKRELRKEKKAIKENVRKRDGVIYIGGGTLLLIIIIILLV